jgi:hypothetical protein
MSALPPKADIVEHDRDARLVPKRGQRTQPKIGFFRHATGGKTAVREARSKWGSTDSS